MNKPFVLLLLSLTACGGGSGDVSPDPGPFVPPDTLPQGEVTRVTLTGTTSLAFYNSSSFGAVVEGTGRFSPEVTWSLVSGGGTLSATTGATITYTAPLVLAVTPVTLRAVSQTDPSKAGILVFNITPPPPAGEFLAGTYAGTQSISRQEGDEDGQYDPSAASTEETGPSTYRLLRESDTQLRLSFFEGRPQEALIDLHPDGTLTLAEQDTGYLPQGRCVSSFRITQGTQTGSGTWDYKGNLTLRWPSRETYYCNLAGPGVPPEYGSYTRYKYREHRFTAVKDPQASYPW